MSRRNLLIGIGVVVVLAVGAFAIWWFSAGSGVASEEISAPTLSVNETSAVAETTATPEAADDTGDMTEAATEAVDEASEGAGDAASATDEATAPAADDAATDAAATGTADAAAQRTLYRISPEDSAVRFIITEELRGQPTTVIGVTNEVAGDIIADFSTPANAEVGTIRINVRTLATDNEFRNRAIRGQILQSAQDEFEFAEFVPTALGDMPDSVTPGEAFSFTITGDLTVRDITSSVTFEVTATASADQLAGTATATVTRAEYGLQIPSVQGVANVSEDVVLEIDFVALPVAE
ncbi:MAG: YceI family protein [Anaerolineae bacterium]|nr:YceI family protein [Anaerolineae bacterium]